MTKDKSGASYAVQFYLSFIIGHDRSFVIGHFSSGQVLKPWKSQVN